MNRVQAPSLSLQVWGAALVLLLASCCRGVGGGTAAPPSNDPDKKPPELVPPLEGQPSGEMIVPHSSFALMPEWGPNDPGVLAPLHPTIAAWGNDPVFSGMSASGWLYEVRGYAQLGVEQFALNLFMLSATAGELAQDGELREAVVFDVAGDKLVPPWLTEVVDGVPSYWGCTNNPTFIEHLNRRISLTQETPGTLLHLDDHAGTLASVAQGGCFCEHCVAGFRSWLAESFDGTQLGDLGVEAIESFDYQSFLHQRGVTSREDFVAALNAKSLPLGEQFLAFQRDSTFEVVQALRAEVEAVWGRSVPLGINAWNTTPTQLVNAHLADYLANEVVHTGQRDTVPPLSYLLGSALERPVFATGGGDDWLQVEQTGAVRRVQGWIAEAYAFGHFFMYAYKKWAHSESRGTVWYQTPVATYLPIAQLLQGQPQLFDNHEAPTEVAVIYDAQAVQEGSSRAMNVVKELHDARIPVSLLVVGNDNVRHRLTHEEAAPYAKVILVNDLSDEATGDERRVVEQLAEDGRLVEWESVEALEDQYSSPVTLQGGDRVWALPRLGTTEEDKLVVHLLNRELDVPSDTFVPKTNLELSIAAERLEGDVQHAWLYAPDAAPQMLPLSRQGTRVSVTIPRLDYWSLVSFGAPAGS